MKKLYRTIIFVAFVCIFITTSCIGGNNEYSTPGIDKGSIRRHAEYFYNQGRKYATILHISGNLSEEDLYEMDKITKQEEEYCLSLSSEEYDYYMKCVEEMNEE